MTLSAEQQKAGEKIATALSDTVAKNVNSTGNDQITKIAAKIEKIVDPKPKWYRQTWFHIAASNAATLTLALMLTGGDNKKPYVPPAPAAPAVAPATPAAKAATPTAPAPTTPPAATPPATTPTAAAFNRLSTVYITVDGAGKKLFIAPAAYLTGLDSTNLVIALSVGGTNGTVDTPLLPPDARFAAGAGRIMILPQEFLANSANHALAAKGVAAVKADLATQSGEGKLIAYRFDTAGAVVRDIGGDKKAESGAADMQALVLVP